MSRKRQFQLEKVHVGDIQYLNDNTKLFMNEKDRRAEILLFEEDGTTLSFKFIVRRKDMIKVRISPNSLEIHFKLLRVEEPSKDKEGEFVSKGVLRNKSITSFIKLSDEELAKNIEKIMRIKAQQNQSGQYQFSHHEEETQVTQMNDAFSGPSSFFPSA